MQLRFFDFIAVWKNLMSAHPASQKLLAFHDRALSERQHRRVGLHVKKCPVCQQEISQFEAAFADYLQLENDAKLDEVPLFEQGLAKLQAALEDFPLIQTQTLLAGEPAFVNAQQVTEQLFAEVEAYFGVWTTSHLVGSVGGAEDPQSFIKAAAPLLTAFLGRKAASRVENQFLKIAGLDGAIVAGM